MFQWSLYSPTTNFVTNLGNVGVVGLGAYMLATGKPGGLPSGVLRLSFLRQYVLRTCSSAQQPK